MPGNGLSTRAALAALYRTISEFAYENRPGCATIQMTFAADGKLSCYVDIDGPAEPVGQLMEHLYHLQSMGLMPENLTLYAPRIAEAGVTSGTLYGSAKGGTP